MSTSSLRPHVPQTQPFRWDGVDELVYKENDSTFRSVTRRVLFGAEHGQGVQARYFEVAPGGYTTLEKHEHTHTVLPIRGRGRALVGTEVVDLAPHDLVFVESWAWHQFQPVGDEPFGMFCLVTAERDRPVKPTEEELAGLEAVPEIAAFIRY